MVAPADGADYGRLSVMLQWRYEMEHLLDVPPEAFDPPPQVQSAVVRMVPRPASELGGVSASALEDLMRASFAQRRKLLRHSLGAWLEQQGYAGNFNLQRRAQEVSVGEYVELARALAAQPKAGAS
jgi:16S rRNA (adenine1518-N6/adenine1519-N6)-dimethyltransferase